MTQLGKKTVNRDRHRNDIGNGTHWQIQCINHYNCAKKSRKNEYNEKINSIYFKKELYELKISEIKISLENTKSKLNTAEEKISETDHYQQELRDSERKRMKEKSRA